MSGLLFPIHEKKAGFAWRQYQLDVVEAVKESILVSGDASLSCPAALAKRK